MTPDPREMKPDPREMTPDPREMTPDPCETKPEPREMKPPSPRVVCRDPVSLKSGAIRLVRSEPRRGKIRQCRRLARRSHIRAHEARAISSCTFWKSFVGCSACSAGTLHC